MNGKDDDENADVSPEATERLLENNSTAKVKKAGKDGDEGCTITAKRPDNIKGIIAKDDNTTK